MRYVTFCVTVRQVKVKAKIASALEQAPRQEGTAPPVLNRPTGETVRHIHADPYRSQDSLSVAAVLFLFILHCRYLRLYLQSCY